MALFNRPGNQAVDASGTGGMKTAPDSFRQELSQYMRQQLERRTVGELRIDPKSRWLYSTDASIYQLQPLGVYFPKQTEDLQALMAICSEHQVSVTPRGGGSSLAGQAIGPGIVLDLSRYLNRHLQIDADHQSVSVDPGFTLAQINQAARKHGLTFGPDPASADRATVGGSVANNATGAHSILFGMAADHLLSAEVVFADGTLQNLGPISTSRAEKKSHSDQPDAFQRLLQVALKIRKDHKALIQEKWPKVWRRASGYSLNYLLPWSPSAPPLWGSAGQQDVLTYPPIGAHEINPATLLAGSEGTLGIMTRLELRLVPLPAATRLGVLAFTDIHQACDAASEILEYQPSAIELLPGSLIRLARSIPAYAHQLGFVQGDPEALLLIEFSGENGARLENQLRKISADIQIAVTPQEQQQVWNIRKMGLGILNSRPGDAKPLAFIEDLAVPVEKLGYFTREMARILKEHGTYGEFYAHASAGCLHIRPVLNLKSGQGVRQMRSIASQAVKLAIGLGGAVSGEHGDGLARSEWMSQTFGPEIMQLFRALKSAVDPGNLLNPGKILDAPPMDANLRYGEHYAAKPWSTTLNFNSQAGLDGAVEMCNGAGVCRKNDGLMCPSFQVTREEEHSTRGRANLLRAYLTGGMAVSPTALSDRGARAVYEALDLCLACKGCKAECPSAVDVAKLKYAFLEQYYKKHPRQQRDYLFANIGAFARYGAPVAGVMNAITSNTFIRRVAGKILGIAPQRKLPGLASRQSRAELRRLQEGARVLSPDKRPAPTVLLLSDAFSRNFHPDTEAAALRCLQAAGVNAIVLPILGAGRTYLSKGFVEKARDHLASLLQEINRIDPAGDYPVVGIEPSEIYTLRDELLDLFPESEHAHRLAARSWMVAEYLLRPIQNGQRPVDRLKELHVTRQEQVLLHGHCYQKAQPPAADGFPVGTEASRRLMMECGLPVTVIPAGCCGMAGAFGYEAEHYQLSMAVAELALLPAVRNAPVNCWIAAAGTSCRSQILDGAGRQALHPLEIVSMVYDL